MFFWPTCAAVVAYRLSAKSYLALSCTSLWHSYGTQLFPFPEKGGEKKTGENDLDYDTSLVHSQLRVRGDVSPGQYHSTVVAIALCPINRFV